MKSVSRLGLVCFAFVSCLVFTAARAAAAHTALLPRPQEIHYGEGVLHVPGLNVQFTMAPNEADRFTAEQLAARLGAAAQTTLPLHAAGTGGPAIVLNRTGDGADLPGDHEATGPESREAYSLRITAEGVEIRAASAAGLFYGAQTLAQMVEGSGSDCVLPVAEVRDWPAMAYRGFMMDFSHGQLLRVPEIERQLDLLARYKANQYFFYSELNIEYDGFELVNPEGRYTQEEVRHVIDYARRRHIDVVPCMELYGHMHDLFRVEAFADAGLPRYGDEFDPRSSHAFELMDSLLDQTLRLFPSPWCHVGFDEPWSLGKIGLTAGKDPFKTFVDVLGRIAGRAQKQGKRILFWADIMEGASTLSNHPELIPQLPGGVIAAPWAYDVLTNYDAYVEPLAKAKVPTLVTPAIWNWNEIFPDYHHTFANINGLTAAGRKFNSLGMLNTGWTDCAQTLYRQSLPGIAFGAAAAWQPAPVDTNTFFAEYSALEYPAAAAPEVAQALEELSEVEELFEHILHNTTQHGFWRDPLEAGHLALLKKQEEKLHHARLLAETADARLQRVRRIAPADPTLNSLLMAARLFDYLGMKSLYVLEWSRYFDELQKHPDPKMVTLYIGIQINQQDHGMLGDLLDKVTGLREDYRRAWLEESTPYRLGSALTRWDGEAAYWLSTWHRVNELLRTHKNSEPFPSIDFIHPRSGGGTQ